MPRVPEDLEPISSNLDQVISAHTYQRVADEPTISVEPVYFDPKAKLNSDAM